MTSEKRTWAYKEGFSIDATEPSSIVHEAFDRKLVARRSRIIDLGAGANPRNALFLARSLECSIDIVDLEAPNFPTDVSDDILGRIKSFVQPVQEFEFGESTYDFAILARLIQYLTKEELSDLLGRVSNGLRMKGTMALSYTAEGGIHERAKEYAIDTYQYDIDEVQELIAECGLETIHLQEGSSQSTHVPHAGVRALTYDILAQKV